MTAKADRVGERYKHCTVVADGGRDRKSNILWRCQCDCGVYFLARGYDLTSGKIISCKCAMKARVIHGYGRCGKKRSKIYSVWATMINRCTNAKDQNFHHYGGRGIQVDPKWREFLNFLNDMGDIPFPKATLERVDNDGHYTKENCIWATMKQQARNRRCSVYITYKEKTLLQSEWCSLIGVSNGLLSYYMKKGLSREDALAYVYERRVGQEGSKETSR